MVRSSLKLLSGGVYSLLKTCHVHFKGRYMRTTQSNRNQSRYFCARSTAEDDSRYPADVGPDALSFKRVPICWDGRGCFAPVVAAICKWLPLPRFSRRPALVGALLCEAGSIPYSSISRRANHTENRTLYSFLTDFHSLLLRH